MSLILDRQCYALLLILIGLGTCMGAESSAINRLNNSITLGFEKEPASLDTLKVRDKSGLMVLEHITEGLTAYDAQGKITEGVASHWTITDNDATFWLRENAYWSDGKAVTAHDFIYAWQEMVRPENAAFHANLLYPIKNAEAINKGRQPIESLGVQAIGDYQLKMTLATPTAYLPELVASIPYRPRRKDVVEQWGLDYASGIDKQLFNGPFTLTEWIHGRSLIMTKNLHYWKKNQVTITQIKVPYFSDNPSVLLDLFKKQKIVFWTNSGINRDQINLLLKERLPIKKCQLAKIHYIEFNQHDQHLTANWHFRKAIESVFDHVMFTNKVLDNPGNTPITSIFPDWLQGKESTFTHEHPTPYPGLDSSKAAKHLKQAQNKLGIDKFPPLVILVKENDIKQAIFIKKVLAESLGIASKINRITDNTALKNISGHFFDLFINSYSPDLNDPIAFTRLFSSTNQNNHGHYTNAEFDNLLRAAESTSDKNKRFEYFSTMQRILHNDVAIIPLYISGDIYTHHPDLAQITRRAFGGDPIFTFARILQRNHKD